MGGQLMKYCWFMFDTARQLQHFVQAKTYLRLWIQPLKYVESFAGVQEMSHAIAVVGDENEQVERLSAVGHLEVEFPRAARVSIHDVTTGQPADVAELLLVLLIMDQQQRFLPGFVISRRGQRHAVIVVEVIIIIHVSLDGVQINIHIFKLPHQKEARRHALPPGNRIAFVRAGAHQLEVEGVVGRTESMRVARW